MSSITNKSRAPTALNAGASLPKSSTLAGTEGYGTDVAAVFWSRKDSELSREWPRIFGRASPIIEHRIDKHLQRYREIPSVPNQKGERSGKSAARAFSQYHDPAGSIPSVLCSLFTYDSAAQQSSTGPGKLDSGVWLKPTLRIRPAAVFFAPSLSPQ